MKEERKREKSIWFDGSKQRFFFLRNKDSGREMERDKDRIRGNWVGEQQCLDTSSEVIVHLKLCGTKYLG